MLKEFTTILSERGNFIPQKEALTAAFHSDNKFKESWSGMYSFWTENPTEKDAMFGNFNFEIDEDDFLLLKEKMLLAVKYLQETYEIKRESLFFQVTNRSLWCSIPAKVFGLFGSTDLFKIHKKMAEEINQYLLKSFDRGLDLAIYRWNGLMRNLGSFLPKSKKWVTKFALNDLEEANSMEELRAAPFDNFFTMSDVEENEKAKQWILSYKKSPKLKNEQKQKKVKNKIHLGMEKFLSEGELSFNRNMHVFSVSLYLKDKGLSLTEAISKIQSSFSNPYVKLREAVRTIKSAFKSSKHFAPNQMKGILDDMIFSEKETNSYKETIIFPRHFIEKLQSVKATPKVYKYLVQILEKKQVNGEDFSINLSTDKNKKRTLNDFQKLVEIGAISYVYNSETKELMAKLLNQTENIYKSHVLLTVAFINSKVFKSLGKELVLFFEILRSGYSQEINKIHFNTKTETLLKQLRMKKSTLIKYMSILKRKHLVIGSKAFTEASNKKRKELFLKQLSYITGLFKKHKNEQSDNKNNQDYMNTYVSTVTEHTKVSTKLESENEKVHISRFNSACLIEVNLNNNMSHSQHTLS